MHVDRLCERGLRLGYFTAGYNIPGVYILFESVRKLISAEIPGPSLPGIIIAIFLFKEGWKKSSEEY